MSITMQVLFLVVLFVYDNQSGNILMAGSPSHEPTAETRNLVKLHVSVGTPQDMICKLLKITGKTLRKHYRDEIDLSTHLANAAVAGSLFNQAKAGNIAASIFWLKTRAGWKEKEEEKPQNDTININIVDAKKPE